MTLHLDRIARRLPLVPRAKPVCPPLGKRLAQIRARSGSPGTAAAALNLAALTASDSGLPDLARDLCLRQAHVFLASRQRFDVPTAQLAIQPLINLARLRTRAGEGDHAHRMFEALFRAAQARTSTTIDGLDIDFDKLTENHDAGDEIMRWLWGVILSDGTRALASAGRWQEALTHVRRHNGVSARMLDGRQIAVLAHSTNQEHERALALITETETVELWEGLVAAVLTVLCLARAGREYDSVVTKMVDRYVNSAANPDKVELFQIRMGMCVIDLAIGSGEQPQAAIAAIEEGAATHDAHVARELLGHPGTERLLTPLQRDHLATLPSASALGERKLPGAAFEELMSLAAEAEKYLLDLPEDI